MSNKAQSIIGYSKDRLPYDFYPTPTYVTEALFKRLKFNGTVYEPSCGDGRMSAVIEKYNTCISADIRTDDEVYGHKNYDFLKNPYINKVENIITNPPFKFATDFVIQAKKIATEKIALILKLSFLEGIDRCNKIFSDIDKFPLKDIYVFSKRIQFSPKGKEAGSPMMSYAWYVWDKEYTGYPTISWINEGAKAPRNATKLLF